MGKKKKPIWAIFYSIALTGFSAFVLLDTFLIPKAEQTVISVSAEIQNSSADEESAVYTENSYTDENISINISTLRKYDTDIYIADITLSSAEYFKTALAKNSYGRNIKEKTSEMAENSNAIFAVNGDFYGFRDDGFVIRNGTLYRDNAGDSDALVLKNDGTLYAVNEKSTDANDLLAENAYQALSFGPILINDSELAVDVSSEVEQAMASNPRTAVGMISPLHYIFIVSDGRTSQSEGLSLYELAEIFKDYSCSFAYNLDGGGSATMWFDGEIVNNPTNGKSNGERKVSDIVYIGY